MKRTGAALTLVIVMASAACTQVPATSSSSMGPVSSGAAITTPPAASATTLESGPATTAAPTATLTPEIAFRALDLPAEYRRGSAEAVDGTTAVGWVQVGINDESPAVWDTTDGTLRVLDVPVDFVHASGETFVKLVGVSGTTAVGTGVLGTQQQRGLDRAMAWDTVSGDLRILDIPKGFDRAEARAIDGSTAVGQVWSRDGETGAAVAWDTTTGTVRILPVPAGTMCEDPRAISGDAVVGTRCAGDEAYPVLWDPSTSAARDLALLPSTRDGVPWSIAGTTAVGWCCIGEEGTPLPLAWDTVSGAARRLDVPLPSLHARAVGVSGTVAVGGASDPAAMLVWNLQTGEARVVPPPAGYEAGHGARAVSGNTIVGTACVPPASNSENPRCVAAAWTLP